MLDKYLSVSGVCVTEKVIEKSRFITTSCHVSGEEEAKAFIAEISEKYRDATHNCFAYICDSAGNFPRFSDDGEPQGTAGMPMLEVIKNNGVFEVAVVVTRYFGGIKLGAGGLVRAYSSCVAENLAAAQKVMYRMCAENAYTVEYASVNAVLNFVNEKGVDVLNASYEDSVTFTVAIKKCEEDNFNSQLLNRLNGKLKIRKEREYFFPFKI